MKIIYDPVKAKEKLERIDAETKAINADLKRHNSRIYLGIRVAGCLFSLSFICLIAKAFIHIRALMFLRNTLSFVPTWLFAIGAVLAVILILTLGFADCELKESFYPTDVKYYLATKDKKVLDTWIEKGEGPAYSLYFSCEDKNGLVYKIFVATLFEKESTCVSESVADLTQNAILIPYAHTGNDQLTSESI